MAARRLRLRMPWAAERLRALEEHRTEANRAQLQADRATMEPVAYLPIMWPPEERDDEQT